MNDDTASLAVTADEVDADQPPSISAARPNAVCVEINLKTRDVDPPVDGWLEEHLARIAAIAGVDEGRICVAVVDDMEMARLHDRYKGVAGTTDVLTFDMRSRAEEPLDVDVVVCRDEAARHAARRGHDTRNELLLYAVHGLLHVTGYDDIDPEGAQAMHRREDELLTAAGFAPVYEAARGLAPVPLEEEITTDRE